MGNKRMSTLEYLEKSERTEKKFPEGKTLSKEQVAVLQYLSYQLLTLGEDFDKTKKHLIYDAPKNVNVPISMFINAKHRDLSQEQMELLHHALGKVTEAIEVFEAVADYVLKDKELDKVNLLEEVGDNFWYDAGILRLLQKTFEDAMEPNIEKLQIRYPGKFTEEHALNRDLEREHDILARDM